MLVNKQEIIHGAQKMSLNLSAETVDKLAHYVELLQFYNKGANFTAVPPAQMVERHILDALSIVPYIKGARILDVGTGPGIPGIILAIVFPEISFSLLDSNKKRIDFCRIVKSEIALDNVELVCARCEAFQTPAPFDQIVSRAFAAMKDFWQVTAHLRGKHTTLVAMKGEIYQEEMASLENVNAEVVPLFVPNLGVRHVVLLKSA